MRKKKSIIFFIVLLQISVVQVFSQGSEFKPSLKIYPSAQLMYGFLFYNIEAGDKNSSTHKHYNQSFNLGFHLNADWKVATDFSLQFYGGYDRWNFANLFPLGLMIKPQINKNKNELFKTRRRIFSWQKVSRCE